MNIFQSSEPDLHQYRQHYLQNVHFTNFGSQNSFQQNTVYYGSFFFSRSKSHMEVHASFVHPHAQRRRRFQSSSSSTSSSEFSSSCLAMLRGKGASSVCVVYLYSKASCNTHTHTLPQSHSDNYLSEPPLSQTICVGLPVYTIRVDNCKSIVYF